MNALRHLQARAAVARTMRRLYLRGLTTASGGNVSARVGDLALITASGTDKAAVRARGVAVVTLDGRNLTPRLRPSIETAMHLEIYRRRPDIRAITHAHPFAASALCAREGLLDTDIAGEARLVLGKPAFAPYALMGSHELALGVAQEAAAANVILMQHHGVITLGKSLLQAYDRLEVLEMTARQNVLRRAAGINEKIAPQDLEAIDRLLG